MRYQLLRKTETGWRRYLVFRKTLSGFAPYEIDRGGDSPVMVPGEPDTAGMLVGFASQSQPGADGTRTVAGQSFVTTNYRGSHDYTAARIGGCQIRRSYDPSTPGNFSTTAATGGNGAGDTGNIVVHHSIKCDTNVMYSPAATGYAASAARVEALLTNIITKLDANPGMVYLFDHHHEPSNPAHSIDVWSTSQKRERCRLTTRDVLMRARARNHPRLRTIWTMMCFDWTLASGSDRDPEFWWPGLMPDGVTPVAEFVGFDGYNEGGRQGTRWDSPGFEYGMPGTAENLGPKGGGYKSGGPFPWMAARNQRKFVVAEFGTHRNHENRTATWIGDFPGRTNSKPDWIRMCFDYFSKLNAGNPWGVRCVALEYFNYNGRNYEGAGWTASPDWTPLTGGQFWTLGTGLACNAASDTITFSASEHVENGYRVTIQNLSAANGLSTSTAYYAVQCTATTFKVSTTKGGAPVNITVNSTCTVQINTEAWQLRWDDHLPDSSFDAMAEQYQIHAAPDVLAALDALTPVVA